MTRVAASAVAAVALGVLVGCSSSDHPGASATTVVRPFSQLAPSERGQRLADCKDLQTAYGQAVTALSNPAATGSAGAGAALDSLAGRLSGDARADARRIADELGRPRPTATNPLDPTTELGRSISRMQAYLTQLCDVTH